MRSKQREKKTKEFIKPPRANDQLELRLWVVGGNGWEATGRPKTGGGWGGGGSLVTGNEGGPETRNCGAAVVAVRWPSRTRYPEPENQKTRTEDQPRL